MKTRNIKGETQILFDSYKELKEWTSAKLGRKGKFFSKIHLQCGEVIRFYKGAYRLDNVGELLAIEKGYTAYISKI